jgi:hypothetical protein
MYGEGWVSIFYVYKIDMALDIQFDGELEKQVLVRGEEKHANPWAILMSNDEVKVRKYLQDVLKGRKLERFYDYAADKRPDVIQQLIQSYALNLVYTKWGSKPNAKFNRESPIKHKAVIMEVMKVLGPNAKRIYGEQLAAIATDESLKAAGKGNVYGWRAPGPPADPESAHLKYRMTNIGSIQQQLPVNVASEVRTRGRTRAIKNELMASTWGNAHTVARREGINTSAFAAGRKGRRTRRASRSRK